MPPKKAVPAPPPASTAPDKPLREATAPLTAGGRFNAQGDRLKEDDGEGGHAQKPHRGNTVETGGLPEPEAEE